MKEGTQGRAIVYPFVRKVLHLPCVNMAEVPFEFLFFHKYNSKSLDQHVKKP